MDAGESVTTSQELMTTPAGPALDKNRLFSLEHLCDYARDLARELKVVERPSRSTDMFFRLQESTQQIQATYEHLTTSGRRGETVSGDAEWLLDNYYVVEEQLQEIKEDLPPRYFAQLPKLDSGEPRVYRLAHELILHTDGLLDEDTIVAYAQAFQSVAPLTIGEMWAVPIMLRIGLVEYLGKLSMAMKSVREQRSRANAVLQAWPGGEMLPTELQRYGDEQLQLHALIAVDETSADDVVRLAPLERLLLEQNPALHDRVREHHQRQAASQLSVGNVITAMRLLSALDWIAFFENCSVVEQILRTDPSGTYGQMDYESRDRYRHALEKIARRTKATELDIAQTAVNLARMRQVTSPLEMRQRHVGYWLVDEGRHALETQFEYTPSWRDRLVRGVRAAGLAGYLGSIFTATAAMTVAILSLTVGWQSGYAWWLLVPLALAVSEFAVGLVNYLVTRILPPRTLPHLELRDGIPAESRTIVVVPSMLSGKGEVASLLERLEQHYVANSDPNLCFALLTDFTDASEESLAVDQELIQQATRGIDELNRKYGASGAQPFYLFHRRRMWNAQEGSWMGWERKRGKLMEFNQLLQGATDTSYTIQHGDLPALTGPHARRVRYVITCDADTQLPHGSARRLVGTLSHPLNCPRIDPVSQRVEAGYSLIQPRITVALADAHKSWYVRIMANSQGIDPYGTAASDVYQDLFGEGSFTGKGIYDLEVFERNLDCAFPENQILSHDLIEGCHVRTALASDIELIDGFPTKYEADARRQHRWIRGDWQIAPWLFFYVPSATGRRPNTLSFLSRWKIADNLRRSLASIAILITMVPGWLIAPEFAGVFSLVGLLCLSIPAVISFVGVLESLAYARDLRTALRAAGQQLQTVLLQVGVLAISLPHRAVMTVDAIARTLWRMFVSQRKMLEWQTAASTEVLLSSQKASTAVRLWYVAGLAVLLAVVMPRAALPAAALWLVAWFFAPLILDLISRPRKQQSHELDEPTRLWLRQVSRRNWNYFEDNLGPHNHWLPPDNVQEYPKLRVADRLSPTNEGLFLVSVIAARDFGYLGLQSMATWWERNLTSLCQLPKAGGHFFNWYDTTTLQPLKPRYLSTVDSGNLAASLIVVEQGLEELPGTPVLPEALWQGLADSVAIAEEATSRPDYAPGTDQTGSRSSAAKTALSVLKRLCAQPPASIWEWPRAIGILRTCLLELTPATGDEGLNGDSARSIHLAVMEPEIRNLKTWLESILHDYDQLFRWVDHIAAAESVTPSTVNNPAMRGAAALRLAEIDASADTPAVGQRSAGAASPAESHWYEAPECRALWQRLKSELEQVVSLSDLLTVEQRLDGVLAEFRAALSMNSSNANSGNANSGGSAEGSRGRLWLAELTGSLRACAKQAAEVTGRFDQILACVKRLNQEMDFKPLYDPLRRLFSIGYNMEDGRLDGSYYDMLCSEARLSSYVAIAKGDVPVRHWFRLGRQTTYTAGQTGLLSWGGTMFEFLMPLMFQPRVEGSLLSAACQAAVSQQQKFARQRGVPWGVSESAFAAMSPNSDYQYQSFGVPGLGLKRGLSKDNVVAPYATMLALEVDTPAAVSNLRRLEQQGLLALWGFYEAVDYTPSRLPEGRDSVPVRCFMAHHQGMSFLSLANLLNQEGIRRRFRSHPLMKAAELLLQEGVPVSAPMMMPHTDEVADVRITRPVEQPVVSRRIATYDTPTPRTHLLSNGSYAVMLTNAGGGYSRHRETMLSRWRADVTRDHWGQWLYISDPRTADYWSATYQPTLKKPDNYEVIYSIDKAEFRRQDGEISSSLEIAISPEDPVEVRQLKLTNEGRKERTLDVTSYLEVVLASAAADLAHPAFQKLFVETEYIPESMALLARRRPRDASDAPLWMFHVLCPGDASLKTIEYETSRVRFLGRGRTAQSPLALDPGHVLSQTTGPVLDPVLAIRCRINVPAESCVHVAVITGYAATREEALHLADLYHDWRAVQRAFELAWAYNQIELRHWRTTAAQTHRFQRLASAILYPSRTGRGPESSLLENRLGQNQLWPFGISGDRSIVLIRIDHSRQLNFVREHLIAQEYWAYRQFHVDLVLLNCLPGSYLDELQEQLERLVRETPHRAEVRPGRAFVLRCAQLSKQQLDLLETVAAVVIDASRGWSHPALQPVAASTAPQTATALTAADALRKFRPQSSATAKSKSVNSKSGTLPAVGNKLSAERHESLEFWNGYGGFADEGREYLVAPVQGRSTPMPWSNVIANPVFGCLVTECGGGFTWAMNSRENKLTTWSNDPVSDPPSEQLYVKDCETLDVWPVFGGRQAVDTTRRCQHGNGWSRWTWETTDLQATVTVSIAESDPVKFIEVELQNRSSRTRSLSLTYFVEWVLGVTREETQLHLITEVDSSQTSLLARNAYHPEYADQVVFLKSLGGRTSVTGDRREFLGRNGDPCWPQGLAADHLPGNVGVGLDPCGAIQTEATVAPQQAATIVFMLGRGASRAEAVELQEKYSTAQVVNQALEQQRSRWDDLLSQVQVETPDRAFDVVTNRWMVYQTLSCRMWGRSGFYQSSGAYGFRDQLQDAMALVYASPDLVREHLLRAAARQYVEGDVQHWWHIPTGRGTRTRFSDDLLWLILATCHYVDVTQDHGVWEEQIPFLQSPLLAPDEHERYECPQVSNEQGTLYEHCLRALRHAFRLGPHGLPLIGCGDWNDGMNKIGEGGKGESVWVGWFLMVIIDRFLPVMQQRKDQELATDYRNKRAQLWKQLEWHAWDGDWYRRAYFDDGTPLGSHLNEECQIDSLSQSWAVLAGADAERSAHAVDAAIERLVRPDDHLVALLTPPFDRSTPNPGYIMGYLKGVRENGGQYTHAVLWLIQALTELGDGDRAFAIFDLINPVRQTTMDSDVTRYQVEPYVMAADVYSEPPHVGRGGWTWYTGSASWMYRTAVENILGLQRRGDRISFRPCVPDNWSHFKVTLRHGTATWTFRVELHDEGLEPAAVADLGWETPVVDLVDDGGDHEVVLHCRRRKSSQDVMISFHSPANSTVSTGV